MSPQAVCKVTDLTTDVPFAVEVDDELTVAIVRHGGKIYAIEDECSHGKVALSEGDVVDDTIECYLHGSVFDLATGRPLNLPATEPVRVFACHIEGDDVLIDVHATVTQY
ncbi:non-heme iron oxygenase ferredoxin subunit [Tessaracoccus sp. MC1865]|uniref:non-heme iron oxygenase ferredoxin subunit n=1 Tax=unclassified Tessaracoccus TaxID=2635419 RepID=UPI0016004378|nr:non-heme iron oxygenase ferredoxin subunit [Tessaracoccus sp. MC1865]MBB1483544.1 non-heme iron oxygenase ferredoxin subunit [Tessaracoccus sp. MC1865]MBB1508961.1 non-heme iron oxygenase ferredoxin subunit [Tessaracoccus sp. MC1756]QTO36634.1 non-heme iron oxygenase ferredoxin subunit [Tessaracoccus sp. MC1865]